MKSLRSLPLLVVFLAAIGCSSSQPDTLVQGGYDEAEMDAAIKRAIGEVDSFITELESGTGTDYAIKVPIEDAGKTEHFWLIDVSFSNGTFSGTINNDPGMVSNVTIGQKYSVEKTGISDWMYMKDGLMYGNYTLRPLLVTLPEEEAEFYRTMFATP